MGKTRKKFMSKIKKVVKKATSPTSNDALEVVEIDKKHFASRLDVFNSKGINNICLHNNISKSHFTKNLNQIVSLEMCHYNFVHFPTSFSTTFKHLQSLTVIAQDLMEIIGVNELPSLEKLWICETKISKIQGLDRLPNLKELYLYSNFLTKIENLEHVVKLEVLWLSDNDIHSLENLEHLTNLHQFQCGNNKISKIGNSFHKNLKLKDIMLSGNLLSNFREILHLVSLPNLESLSLSDPNFRENPISALYNYQTHVILHLPQLKFLDTLEITAESRRVIGATVLKKIMYYNMRINTIKRNENFLINTMKTKYLNFEKHVEEDSQTLIGLSKRFQRRFNDYLISKPINTPSVFKDGSDSLKTKINVLTAVTHRKLQDLSLRKQQLKQQIQNQGDNAIRKLLLELETGGNIRFEDEVSDNWADEAVEILGGIIDRGVDEFCGKEIHVNRISKIHNRHLKSVFDSKIKENEVSQLQYLVFQPSTNDVIFEIVENGFGSFFLNKKERNEDPNPTHKSQTNLLLRNYLEINNETDKSIHESFPESKQLLIVKIWAPKVSKVASINDLSMIDHRVNEKLTSGAMFEFPAAQNDQSDHQTQRQIYNSFTHQSILPVFMVEYIQTNIRGNHNGRYDDESVDIPLEKKVLEISRTCHLTHPFLPLNVVEDENDEKIFWGSPINDLMPELLKYPEMKSVDFPTNAFTMGTLLREPNHTVETLNLSFGRSRFEEISYVNTSSILQTTSIISQKDNFLTSFQTFVNLKTLVLSNVEMYNEKPLENSLKHFVFLENLDLSLNYLTSLPISTLSELKKLKTLDLMGNKIDDFGKVLPFSEAPFNKQLLSLDLRYNPFCDKKETYKQIFIQKMTSITNFDGSAVIHTPKLAKEAFKTLIDIHSSCQNYIFRPMSVRAHLELGSTTSFHEYWDSTTNRTVSMLANDEWKHDEFGMTKEIVENDRSLFITTLELDNCNLVNLNFLPESMPSLRWASFRNNQLRNVDKLEGFHKLEEISLSGNQIEHLECLISLPHLARLDASNNLVSTIVSACSFKSLLFLSLDGNRIKSLKEFAHNHTLMELYLGNNLIKELFSIFLLKDIPRLIILDLTGNEISLVPSYRSFLIFHMYRLKILDGANISQKEQLDAKELLYGRLTVEMLGEKIGHFSFKNIVELDLRNCKIKEIDNFSSPLNLKSPQMSKTTILLNGGLKSISQPQTTKQKSAFEDFKNLKRLNFDGNLLTNIDSLVGLRSLRFLSLNNNRIERLLTTDMPSIGNLSASRGNLDGEFGSYSASGLQLTSFTNSQKPFFFPNLQELHLGGNLITKISDLGLHRILQLRHLYLHTNKIKKIDGLEHMTNLSTLVLDKNQIKWAEPSSFLSLVSLRELSVKENRIRSLSHFDCLPNLLRLYLQSNRIQDLVEVEKFNLPNLQEIAMAGNAVCKRQIYRVTLLLRCLNLSYIDGRDVTVDERQRVEMVLNENLKDNEIRSVPPPPMTSQQLGPMIKLPIKIKSVVLDGFEMKLSSTNNNAFGSSSRAS